MPELPEVEQVRLSLGPHVDGKTILGVRLDLPKWSITRPRRFLPRPSRAPKSPV
ncbi:DNA-formamidopyrimidine glycosylase family protein [Acidaminococcus provencensis]|uniref:DNA-formamidopyrimidine glycosylase family protein n=1 Tax=Acidaminococcus provencensis TaxID=2058289 RepID=UPI0023F2FC38|nr:DNA-formamidopyrimidine glycosylase family protein [Acidaminococcus provencensis]